MAKKNLQEVKAVFDKFDIRYWLDLGTLLGAVRDGKIIPWDDDIDFGVMDSSWEKIVSILPEFRKRGFFVECESSESPVNYRYISLYRLGCFVGVYPFSFKNDYAVRLDIIQPFFTRILTVIYHFLSFNDAHSTSKNRFLLNLFKRFLILFPSKLRKPLSKPVWILLRALKEKGCTYLPVIVPKQYFEKLITIKFYEDIFSIPSNVEEYLEFRYGKDWKVPKKEWEWWNDDGAAKFEREEM